MKKYMKDIVGPVFEIHAIEWLDSVSSDQA